MLTRKSRVSKRFMVVASAAVLCGSTLALSGAAQAGPGAAAPDSDRIAGANRWGTAGAVSDALDDWDVVIANGLAFPDGLSAAVYADSILLTEAGALPAETIAELTRLTTPAQAGPGGLTITVVGGESAVSSDVFEDLQAFGSVTRIAGANRYATAIAVAKDYGACGNVILATGENFPDALAAGPLAAWNCAPILLNSGASVRSDVAAYLLDPTNGISHVTIVGGTSAIPASVETQLTAAFGLTVERLAGSNRAATATAIADELGWTSGVTLVNGTGFADALAAGPFAYDSSYPIVLSDNNGVPAATASYLNARCLAVAEVIAIGGTSAVSNATLTAAVGEATCSSSVISSATLLNNDFKQTVQTLNTGLLVTAKAGTLADGAAGNFVQFAAIQNGTPGEESVILDMEGDNDPTYGGLPTVVMTYNFNTLTNQGFINVFNASPAAALFTASLVTPADGTGTFGVGFGSAAPGTVYAPGSLLTTPGSQDSTVVVTFERPVSAATTSGLYPNLNPASGPILGAPTTVSPTPIPAAGTTVMTYKWEDVALALPSLPFNQIRFAVGDITDHVSGLTNGVPVAATLTAP